jgi:hypothetical protein
MWRRFTSSRNQSITAAALAAGDSFSDLDIIIYSVGKDTKTTPVEIIRSITPSTYSPTTGIVDWAIWHANAGDVYEVLVITPSSSPSRYRLMILGTGFKQGSSTSTMVDVDPFNHLNIVGAHQDNFCRRIPSACP